MPGIRDIARSLLAAVGDNLSLRSIRLIGVACVGLARLRIDLSTPYIYSHCLIVHAESLHG